MKELRWLREEPKAHAFFFMFFTFFYFLLSALYYSTTGNKDYVQR